MSSVIAGRRISFRRVAAVVVVTLAALSTLTGCSLGTMEMSGPAPADPVTVHVDLNGTVHGGQNPVSYSTLNLYVAGSGSYGATATALDTSLTGASEYYPGGTTGCLIAADTITGFASTSSTATFTATNSLKVGQLVTISGSTSALNGSTVAVTAATSATFTVADTLDGANGFSAASGTATPICYTLPTTDSNGNFTLNGDYSCGTHGSSIAYIVASGGNPGLTVGTNNSHIALAAPLGTCSSLSSSTTIIVNELTTTAMAFAMGQYFGNFGASVDSFGAPTTTQGALGFTNAYGTVANLVTVSTGQPVVTATTTSSLGTVTITPESGKLTTIANVLASCVNSNGSTSAGSNCLTLFTDVTPTGGTTPTDTLQAAVYMSLNPTSLNTATSLSNITALYGLATSSPAFVGGLTGQPSDWTLGITYASASTQVVNTFTEGVLTYPERLAVDASGNVWVVNNVTSPTNPATNVAGVTEMTPTGTLVKQVLTGSGVLAGPRAPTFDSAGNLWVANFGSATATNSYGYGKTVAEYTTGGVTNTYNVAGCPTWLAGDGAGNMFVAECSTAVTNTGGGNGTPGSDFEEIPANSTSGTSGTVLANAASGYSMTTYGTIGIDSNYNAFIATGGTTTLAFKPPYTGTALSFTSADPEPLAIDNSNDVFVANYGTTGVDKLTIVSNALTNASGAPYTGGGLAQAELGAIDGAGNFWITNYTSSSTGYLVEFSNAGVPQSPTTGGFAHTFHGAFGVAVDPSGNVWVGNNTVYTLAASAATGTGPGGAAAGGYLTEIVGAAVPVVTPIAAGLPAIAGGTSTLGSRP